VDAITSTARSIGEHNLSRRLQIPRTGDELQRLSETFNQMMDRLEAAFKRITQFTADASHELRTPVALMRTAAELSLRRQRNEADYKEALSQILEEAERMSVLIESLMTLARMDSGSETLNLKRVDLASILRGVCTQSETLAESKQIRFQYDLPAEAVPVDADELAIRRLFLILIDNAIKYTAAGGLVHVKLETDGRHAVVEVGDTGIGIPNEDIPHIFERFFRADKARSREIGAGLGLSIARWIADVHNANIEVDSILGAGSCFKFSMRCAATAR
jgi:signal transduction histidine kinase